MFNFTFKVFIQNSVRRLVGIGMEPLSSTQEMNRHAVLVAIAVYLSDHYGPGAPKKRTLTQK